MALGLSRPASIAVLVASLFSYNPKSARRVPRIIPHRTIAAHLSIYVLVSSMVTVTVTDNSKESRAVPRCADFFNSRGGRESTREDKGEENKGTDATQNRGKTKGSRIDARTRAITSSAGNRIRKTKGPLLPSLFGARGHVGVTPRVRGGVARHASNRS